MGLLSGISIDQRSVDTGGRSTGFDYLRIILATAVIAWHSFGTSYGLAYAHDVLTGPIRPIVALILPMFFALSGFLVAGSLYRTKALSTFAGLRIIRILPALAVEVLLSAFILGPILTTSPLKDYFTSPILFHYFENIAGDIHYQLPGLFLNDPIPNVVNGQLWTVPWEMKCYLVLTGIAFFGLAKKRLPFLGLVVLATAVVVGYEHFHGHGPIVRRDAVSGPMLVISFLSAIVIYQFKDKIPWNGWLAALSAAVMFACLWFPGGDYFVGFPAAYTTIWLGLLNPRKIALLRGADYSYGLYLYGFAIQQAVAQIGSWTHHWYINLLMTMVAGSLFAAFSWHVVEKPALRLKKFLPWFERLLAKVPFPRSKAE